MDDEVLIVKGDSMLPTLHEGDCVVIEKKNKYDVGDIIVFEYPQEKIKRLLIHRIVGINEHFYLCKGDNSTRIEFVIRRKIYGKVVKKYDGFGKKRNGVCKKLLSKQ